MHEDASCRLWESNKINLKWDTEARGKLGRKTDSDNASINPLTPNDLKKRHAVSPLKIKIPSKNMREKPTSTTIIHSVY
jgi:hypothetical protein